MNAKYNRNLIFLFWTIIASRIFSMFLYPLTDSTEARYAHIALLMAKTNNWITPWFDYNVPFWGKPPLSFWFQALSYKIFGIYDFVPRVPSLLVTLATAWLLYKYVLYVKNKTTALLSIVIFASTGLVYVLSGAVLTDPYLSFATALSFVSLLMVIEENRKYWDYMFFVGLGIGLLSKGPLTLVIVGGTITIWVLFSFKNRMRELAKLPWFTGIILMLLISVPWYIAAEYETPGFLHYFIVGEHIDRFLDPAWKGDLYGGVHKRVHGYIWYMWLYTSLPWGLSGLILLFRNIFKKPAKKALFKALRDDSLFLCVIWMLFMMIFFTIGSNMISTYVLPSLPPLAIVLAIYLNRNSTFLDKNKKVLYFNAFLAPVIMILVTIYFFFHPATVKTEKFLMQRFEKLDTNNEPVYFLGKQPFSMKYYYGKKITITPFDKFNKLLKEKDLKYYVIINKSDIDKVKDIGKLTKLDNSYDCLLYEMKN